MTCNRTRYKRVLSPPKFPGEDDGYDGDDDMGDIDIPTIMREEERFGKWIGLFFAVIMWGVICIVFIATRPPRETYNAGPTAEELQRPYQNKGL